jgi:L-asparagine oxygenase
MMTTDPIELLLSEPDWDRLMRLADRLRIQYGTPDHRLLSAQAPLILREVPDDLALFLRAFQREEPAGAAVVRGGGIDDKALGLTPPRYDPPYPTDASVQLGFYITLLGYALGEPFAWSNLQGGRLVQNVLPVAGDEHLKSGTSSASTLELHTEDAAHPARADWLLLMCLRNPDKVPTGYASLAQAALDPAAVKVLMEPRFIMESEPDHAAALGATQQVAVLSGDPDDPYLVYDELYLSAVDGDAEAETALAHLTASLKAVATDVFLEPGDTVIIHNPKATHSRGPIPFRGDGSDRWYLREHVTGDLSRSRRWRASAASPVILAGS